MIQLNLSPRPSPEKRSNTPIHDVGDVQQRLSVVLSGKYRILKQLGEGGMSTVWLARHRIHGALFALKVFHPSLADIPELKEMFYREALHAAALAGHPNIVPVFDIDQADGLHYLVLPYVRGCDLDEALKHCGRFSLQDALTVALEVATTLEYAETCGIQHGDLSPGNVRIDEFGRVLLLDFGLSRSIHLSGSANLYKLGTPYAMSPEQIRGETSDIRSDLYAAGILLYQMLTGEPPFSSETIEAIEEWHLRGALHIPAEIKEKHGQVTQLLEHLLAKEPKNRPQNAKALELNLLQLGALHRQLDIARLLPQEKDQTLPRRRLSEPAEQS